MESVKRTNESTHYRDSSQPYADGPFFFPTSPVPSALDHPIANASSSFQAATTNDQMVNENGGVCFTNKKDEFCTFGSCFILRGEQSQYNSPRACNGANTLDMTDELDAHEHIDQCTTHCHTTCACSCNHSQRDACCCHFQKASTMQCNGFVDDLDKDGEIIYEEITTTRRPKSELGHRVEPILKPQVQIAAPIIERVNQGVAVRPVTRDVGVGCSAYSSDTDAWVDQCLDGENDKTRKLVKRLLRYASESKEEFCSTLTKILNKQPPRSKIRPICVLSHAEYKSAKQSVEQQSKSVEKKPDLVDRQTMTGSGYTRSQGTMMDFEVKPHSSIGIQVDLVCEGQLPPVSASVSGLARSFEGESTIIKQNILTKQLSDVGPSSVTTYGQHPVFQPGSPNLIRRLSQSSPNEAQKPPRAIRTSPSPKRRIEQLQDSTVTYVRSTPPETVITYDPLQLDQNRVESFESSHRTPIDECRRPCDDDEPEVCVKVASVNYRDNTYSQTPRQVDSPVSRPRIDRVADWATRDGVTIKSDSQPTRPPLRRGEEEFHSAIDTQSGLRQEEISTSSVGEEIRSRTVSVRSRRPRDQSGQSFTDSKPTSTDVTDSGQESMTSTWMGQVRDLGPESLPSQPRSDYPQSTSRVVRVDTKDHPPLTTDQSIQHYYHHRQHQQEPQPTGISSTTSTKSAATTATRGVQQMIANEVVTGEGRLQVDSSQEHSLMSQGRRPATKPRQFKSEEMRTEQVTSQSPTSSITKTETTSEQSASLSGGALNLRDQSRSIKPGRSDQVMSVEMETDYRLSREPRHHQPHTSSITKTETTSEQSASLSGGALNLRDQSRSIKPGRSDQVMSVEMETDYRLSREPRHHQPHTSSITKTETTSEQSTIHRGDVGSDRSDLVEPNKPRFSDQLMSGEMDGEYVTSRPHASSITKTETISEQSMGRRRGVGSDQSDLSQPTKSPGHVRSVKMDKEYQSLRESRHHQPSSPLGGLNIPSSSVVHESIIQQATSGEDKQLICTSLKQNAGLHQPRSTTKSPDQVRRVEMETEYRLSREPDPVRSTKKSLFRSISGRGRKLASQFRHGTLTTTDDTVASRSPSAGSQQKPLQQRTSSFQPEDEQSATARREVDRQQLPSVVTVVRALEPPTLQSRTLPSPKTSGRGGGDDEHYDLPPTETDIDADDSSPTVRSSSSRQSKSPSPGDAGSSSPLYYPPYMPLVVEASTTSNPPTSPSTFVLVVDSVINGRSRSCEKDPIPPSPVINNVFVNRQGRPRSRLKWPFKVKHKLAPTLFTPAPTSVSSTSTQTHVLSSQGNNDSSNDGSIQGSSVVDNQSAVDCYRVVMSESRSLLLVDAAVSYCDKLTRRVDSIPYLPSTINPDVETVSSSTIFVDRISSSSPLTSLDYTPTHRWLISRESSNMPIKSRHHRWRPRFSSPKILITATTNTPIDRVFVVKTKRSASIPLRTPKHFTGKTEQSVVLEDSMKNCVDFDSNISDSLFIEAQYCEQGVSGDHSPRMITTQLLLVDKCESSSIIHSLDDFGKPHVVDKCFKYRHSSTQPKSSLNSAGTNINVTDSTQPLSTKSTLPRISWPSIKGQRKIPVDSLDPNRRSTSKTKQTTSIPMPRLFHIVKASYTHGQLINETEQLISSPAVDSMTFDESIDKQVFIEPFHSPMLIQTSIGQKIVDSENNNTPCGPPSSQLIDKSVSANILLSVAVPSSQITDKMDIDTSVESTSSELIHKSVSSFASLSVAAHSPQIVDEGVNYISHDTRSFQMIDKSVSTSTSLPVVHSPQIVDEVKRYIISGPPSFQLIDKSISSIVSLSVASQIVDEVDHSTSFGLPSFRMIDKSVSASVSLPVVHSLQITDEVNQYIIYDPPTFQLIDKSVTASFSSSVFSPSLQLQSDFQYSPLLVDKTVVEVFNVSRKHSQDCEATFQSYYQPALSIVMIERAYESIGAIPRLSHHSHSLEHHSPIIIDKAFEFTILASTVPSFTTDVESTTISSTYLDALSGVEKLVSYSIPISIDSRHVLCERILVNSASCESATTTNKGSLYTDSESTRCKDFRSGALSTFADLMDESVKKSERFETFPSSPPTNPEPFHEERFLMIYNNVSSCKSNRRWRRVVTIVKNRSPVENLLVTELVYSHYTSTISLVNRSIPIQIDSTPQQYESSVSASSSPQNRSRSSSSSSSSSSSTSSSSSSHSSSQSKSSSSSKSTSSSASSTPTLKSHSSWTFVVESSFTFIRPDYPNILGFHYSLVNFPGASDQFHFMMIDKLVSNDFCHKRASPSSSPSSSSAASVDLSRYKLERNYKYFLSDDLNKALNNLSAHYRISPMSDKKPPSKDFDQAVTAWFDLTKSAKPAYDSVQDYMVMLRDVSPTLLREVVQAPDINRSTALHYAVGHGAWPVVKLILDSGYAQPNRFNTNGYTPIMVACISNIRQSNILLLLDRLINKSGAEVNFRSRNTLNETALSIAARHNSVELVKLLMQNPHIDVNLSDASGNSPLELAVKHRFVDVVEALLMVKAGSGGEGQGHQLTEDVSSESKEHLMSLAAKVGDEKIDKLLHSHFDKSK